MGQVAQYETKKAYLCYDFGYELAVKWFGQEVVDALPKNKSGKTQGMVVWNKCTRGGWHPLYYKSSGSIEKRVGSVVGKVLYRTDWTFIPMKKKTVAINTEVASKGDHKETWF